MKPTANATLYTLVTTALFVYAYFNPSTTALVLAILMAVVSLYWVWKAKRK